MTGPPSIVFVLPGFRGRIAGRHFARRKLSPSTHWAEPPSLLPLTPAAFRLGLRRFGLVAQVNGKIGCRRFERDVVQHVVQVAAVVAGVVDQVKDDLQARHRTLIDRQSAVADFHWTLLAQPHPIPERLFGSDTDFLVNTLIDRWAGDPKKINAFARQAYLKAYWRPEALRGAIEDYRAGSTLDFEHDRADQEAGRKIACPVLALWAESNEVGPECSPIEVWKDWAEAVEGAPIRESGHFLQEEAPETVARHLADFL